MRFRVCSGSVMATIVMESESMGGIWVFACGDDTGRAG
jgi:hypothetical protein